MKLWKYLVLYINVISWSQHHVEGQIQGVDVFYTCNGKPSAAGKYFQEKLPILSTCLAGVPKPKYCMFRCMLMKLGMLDSSGQPKFDVIESELTKYNMWGPETANIYQASKECNVKGKNYASEERNCHNMKEYYYCVYNKYNKICHNSKFPSKDINNESKEGGLVKNTATVVDAAGSIL